MVDRVYLSSDDREFIQVVIRRGMLARSADQWTVARLALARSLQEPEAPDPAAYVRLPQPKNGVTLHPLQLIGEGAKDPRDDYSDIYRVLISTYQGDDLFDDIAFHDALQRHVRRGLDLMRTEWSPEASFSRYLLQQFYHDAAPSAPEEVAAAAQADRVPRILGQLGVGANVVEVNEGPRLTRLTLELQSLDDLDRLRKGLGKLAFALGQGENAVSSSLAPGERRVFLSIPRPDSTWRSVNWQSVRPALQSDTAKQMALPICLGTDVLGAPFLVDLAEAPHLFVGGTTGSGKSMCLHAILLSLLEGPTDTPQFLLIDPKAVEFTAYGQSPHLIGGEIVTRPDDALAALKDLVEEMNRRQERLRALDARNFAEANARGANLRRIVVVLDELGDLFMTQREIEEPLIRLAQKARSAGIHLVLATQRPEAATFPGLLRSNIPSRVALTVQKSAESRIILDEVGAEALLMRGDMLVRFAGKATVRAHGCRIEQADILAGVRGS
jgi:S-DNA-T family DNA segregation ATPase FtsK/SpoIIIE